MRVLLVDDEAAVRSALARALRLSPGVAEVETAEDAASAITRMDRAPFDVIITDIQMPGMSGVGLLEHVKLHYPRMGRIVLSGHADPEIGGQLVPLIHLHLAKPCSVLHLRDALDRMEQVQARLPASIQKVLVQLAGLPTAPSVYSDLLTTLLDPAASTRDLAEIVERDDAVASKALQMANSSCFGPAHRVTSIQDAVAYLGSNALKAIVLSIESFRHFAASRHCPLFSLAGHKQHGLLVGRIAARMMDTRQDREAAFTAGLLHDIGKLVYAAHLPEPYGRVLADTTGGTSVATEQKQDLPSHALTGAELLRLWGLPGEIVEAVALHHDPTVLVREPLGPGLAVHIANVLAHDATALAGGEPARMESLGQRIQEREDVGRALPAWRAIAAEEQEELANDNLANGVHPA